jgi:hypothetical protein
MLLASPSPSTSVNLTAEKGERTEETTCKIQKLDLFESRTDSGKGEHILKAIKSEDVKIPDISGIRC